MRWISAPGRAPLTSLHGTVMVSDGRAMARSWLAVICSWSAACASGAASRAARARGRARWFMGSPGSVVFAVVGLAAFWHIVICTHLVFDLECRVVEHLDDLRSGQQHWPVAVQR